MLSKIFTTIKIRMLCIPLLKLTKKLKRLGRVIVLEPDVKWNTFGLVKQKTYRVVCSSKYKGKYIKIETELLYTKFIEFTACLLNICKEVCIRITKDYKFFFFPAK